jgi:hypothetical protein
MIQVIGAGFARTGTLSLKMALEHLGFGPCHHLSDHFDDAVMLDRWTAALNRENTEFDQLLAGYQAVVDFPGCLLWRELLGTYPEAKVVLTVRNPTLWYESARRTVLNPEFVRQAWLANQGTDEELGEARGRLSMALAYRGFPHGLGMDETIRIFEAHNRAVQNEVPPQSLLHFEVTQGWAPLCAFLGVDEPDCPFPCLNDTSTYRKRFARQLRGVAPIR